MNIRNRGVHIVTEHFSFERKQFLKLYKTYFVKVGLDAICHLFSKRNFCMVAFYQMLYLNRSPDT